MAASLGDGEFPVEIERRLANFDEALSEVEDILTNFQKLPYSDMCAQVTHAITGLDKRSGSLDKKDNTGVNTRVNTGVNTGDNT